MEGDGEDDEPLDMWEDFGYGLSEDQRKEMEVSVQPVRSMLVKLRKFSYAVKNSTTILLPEWYRTLKTFRLPERMMPRDVSTRWNSTYDMLEFAVKYRQAIDALTAARDLDLRKYELVAAEWRIAGELRDVLKIFKDATLFFSRGTPNLTTVIPAMDHIDKVLATCSDSPYQFSLAIRAALAVGKAALNKYYNKTDHSEVYRIAMVLHPRHKLEYFRKHEWEQEWIDAALQIVRDEFHRSYASLEADEGASAQGDAGATASSSSHNIFDNLPDLAPVSSDSRDELDRYLATPVEDVKDALMWWFERSEAFPLLSHLLLLIVLEATTVGVERVFSQGRLVLPHVRNRLNFQTTRSLMCIGTWSLLGLVKYKDVKSVFGDDVEGPEDELPTGWDAITVS
ncbi:hypothetical protein CVT26_002435 [Gymnopilus dilepis]|uniref:HAT C-terminal dimerisation domain-containing protein n=1 Tax=Gymnopilus dilepis TaxID=231916 RepID=A0A409Y3Y8_9AGAR|nr:hypothetical protein CVT26_002435 [Gymnopilus dilepis]